MQNKTMSSTNSKKHSYLVIGGELESTDSNRFSKPSEVDFVGVFNEYQDALSAWKSKAQSTVDNALMRYFVVTTN